LGEKTLAKSLLIPTLDQVIYYIGTFLQGSTKLHKIGWRSAEKNSPIFFNMRVLYLDFYGGNKKNDLKEKRKFSGFP
jgi:hypothetical protein